MQFSMSCCYGRTIALSLLLWDTLRDHSIYRIVLNCSMSQRNNTKLALHSTQHHSSSTCSLTDSVKIKFKKMKFLILSLLCMFISSAVAYPVNPNQEATRVIASPLRPSQERAFEDIDQLVDEVHAQTLEDEAVQWRNVLRLLIKNEQKRYTDVEIEGITSFFDNLRTKFEDFGKRMKHAFRPSGK